MDQVLLEVRDSTLDPPRRPEVPQACNPLIQALMQVSLTSGPAALIPKTRFFLEIFLEEFY